MPIVAGVDIETKDDWIIRKFSGDEYEVTIAGILISRASYHSGVARVLKTAVNPRTGYAQIVMWDKCVKKSMMCLVHRIVALLHIPNPMGLPQVNHKDGDKLNNAVPNLEWCDSSGNNKHAYSIGLRSAVGEGNGYSKLTEIDVLNIRNLRETVKTKYRELGEMFGVHEKTIGEVCRREIWRHI